MAPYCRRCDRYFNSPHALNQHLQNSNAHAVLLCPHCNATFEDYDDLQSHKANEHFECACCSRVFDSPEERKRHELNGHLYCRTHKQSFQAPSNLRAHLNSTYHVGRTIPCVCTAKFPTLSALFLHIEERGCSDITPHLLRHLTVMMAREYNYKLSNASGPMFEDPAGTLDKWTVQYAFNCRNEEGEGFPCHGCDSTFDRRTRLIRHLYSVAADSQTPWTCLYCDAEFRRGSGLLQHRESGSCRG